MSGRDDDRPSWAEREKKSFSELDRMRREGRSGGERPTSAAARERSAAATKQYLKEVEGVFSGGSSADAAKLAEGMLDARGTPGLAAACRAYREAVGLPSEIRHVSCFLDCGDRELVLAGLEALRLLRDAGALEVTAGLRSQLRVLEQDADDEIAEASEELLEVI